MNIVDYNQLGPDAQRQLLERPKSQAMVDPQQVISLIEDVRTNGDDALKRLTERFDGVTLTALNVTEQERSELLEGLAKDLLLAIDGAKDNIQRYHKAQVTETISVETATGVRCERVTRPIQRVGLYVPAGTAPLPSTALMLAVPATLAGCREIVLCTPPNTDGKADAAVIAAAEACGVQHVFKLGGVQAVAAMAYGTESVPKVDKIFGPGNSWVTAAKQLVSVDPQGAALDMPAGPSEVLVIADELANPGFVASDLLSQAEHGPDSQVICLTPSDTLAKKVATEIHNQLAVLPRVSIATEALENSRIIVTRDLAQAFLLSNNYAPEHLILNVDNARSWLDRIENAGSVFLGPWTPESIGDYCSGTNHVLPTYGYAKAYSGLSLKDFQKQISIQELEPQGLQEIGWIAETLATAEGLHAHREAVSLRLRTLENP